MTGSTTTLDWQAPGKGEWRGLHDHFPRALTPEFQTLLCEGMIEGEGDYFARYGLPAQTLEPRFVHGRVFIGAKPLMGSYANGLPPAPLLWLAVRAAPAFRRRARAAARAIEDRIWLAEADRWYAEQRPAWEARNAAVAAVDPTALSDRELVEHVRLARRTAGDGYRDHFALHGTDLAPTSLYLTCSADWGIEAAAAAALLAGSSPASTGAGGLPDWALVTGYDLDERAVVELPCRPTAASPRPVDDVAAVVEGLLRDRVPAIHRSAWDVLLADARATYGVRDDNGVLTAAWPVGLLRRALLEMGDRLVERGVLQHREHAVEATIDELVVTFDDGPGSIGGSALADRADERHRLSAIPAPSLLGPEVALPVKVLPASMQLMMRGLLTLRDLGVTPPGERIPLRGVGIGDQAVTGRASVAADPVEALTHFQPGDIIVTAGTTPAWNTVLALAGGVITEEGGPLSHAAVIARELDLPALVGTAEAVALIPDGATIELDPNSGTVRVLP